MRKRGNSISASVLVKKKKKKERLIVPDLSCYFTLSLNPTPRNYIGFDSLITNDLGSDRLAASTRHQCNHASCDGKSFLSDNLISFPAT
jgi:hypothetical protein